LAKAIKWFIRSAEQGHPPALVNLGNCYMNGEGVLKNEDEASRLYALAAEQNYSWGQFKLAGCYATGRGIYRNLPEAMRLYRLAAEQNLPEACYNLGYYLQRTEAGITANLKEAELWFGRAAELNFAPGQFALAFYKYHGTGIGVNRIEAFRNFKLAAEQGHAEAQGYLGLMYLKGQGT